jgi:membrane associated rhomboid family serine protease
MFPIRDEHRTSTTPLVTFALIALNAAAWVFLQGLGAEASLVRSVCELGLIPGELLGSVAAGTRVPLGEGVSCVITGDANWLTPLTSMFMHGSWFHIIGNMWFLWVFGDNVEEVLGHGRYLLFYLISGFAAAAAQVIADPASAIPMVGASGAIGGVMGAYAVLFPRARIDVLFFFGFFVRVIPMSAIFMLGYWFVIQLLSGSLGGAEGGVAFWAHVGGFAAGAAMVLPLRARVRVGDAV